MTCCVLVFFSGYKFPVDFIQHHKSSVLSSVCKWSPCKSLYDTYTRSISVIVCYTSSRSSLHCLHLVYISLCIWVPDYTSIFYQWTCKSEICLFFILIDGIFRFLRRKPRVLFALLAIEFICWSHCNLFVNMRPKYLADVTDQRTKCMPVELVFGINCLLFVGSTVHLSGWNFMHHSFPSLSRSFCRVSALLLLDIVRYAIVSSAKSLTVDVSLDWRSFIQQRKSPRPRTEPWGTPESTLTASEVDPSITTDCFLFASQFCIHLTDFPIIP